METAQTRPFEGLLIGSAGSHSTLDDLDQNPRLMILSNSKSVWVSDVSREETYARQCASPVDFNCVGRTACLCGEHGGHCGHCGRLCFRHRYQGKWSSRSA